MTLPSIAKHASKYGIIPLKKYGQNFIFDASLCDKIVKVSGLKEGDNVLEIGPGTAGLTRAILSYKPASLTVVETDVRCLKLLEEVKYLYPNLHIIHGDASKYDISSLHHKKLTIISNLPYQIGTELVINWLKKSQLINNMTLMLQKEVVERICGKVGSKSYGRLSVICQLICSVKKSFDVSPRAFYPAPKVHSAIVKLTPFANSLPPEFIEKIELITRLAFGERRKMIKSSLKKLPISIEKLLGELQINPTSRAENLSPQDYLSLAKLFMEHSK